MKRLILSMSVCILAGFGCTVPNDSSIRFLNAHQPTLGPVQSGACSPSTTAIYRGSLDLAGNTQYYVQFDWESNLQQISTLVPPDTIAGPQRNEFVLDHFVFNYSSMPSLGFQPEQVNAYAVQPPGASGSSNWLGIFLLTPQARRVLLTSIQPGDYVGVELLVTFQVFGALASGQKISSNKVTYPINVYRGTGVTCAAGDVRAPNGPCGSPGGQDGTAVVCCRDVRPPLPGCPAQ
jgi:hypothetical protein